MTPLWLVILQSSATTVGVLVAIAVAVYNYSSDRVERRDRAEQMKVLQKAEADRVAAQARKVVPSFIRAEMFGPNFWSVRVTNHSNAVITDLEVTVTGVDSTGEIIQEGASEARNQLSTSSTFSAIIRESMQGSIDAAMQSRAPSYSQFQGLTGQSMGSHVSGALSPQIHEKMTQLLAGALSSEWPTTIAPEEVVNLAYTTDNGAVRPSVKITFTDEAGYRWTRTDKTGPMKLDE